MGDAPGVPPPDLVQWGLSDRTKRRQGYRRWSPKPGQSAKFLILNHEVEWVPTHWWRGVTSPCIGEANGCPACAFRNETRDKGYVCGLLTCAVTISLVELTEYALESCPQLATGKLDLRGRWLRVTRQGKWVNSPVTAEFVGFQPIGEHFPVPDVRRHLERMWNGGYRRSGRMAEEALPRETSNHRPQHEEAEL